MDETAGVMSRIRLRIIFLRKGEIRAGNEHFQQNREDRNMQRKLFTLLELLIVIGVIALLVSILLPALNQVRRRGRSIQCVNNLRQQGYCFLCYTDDSRGWLFTGQYFYNHVFSYAGYPDVVTMQKARNKRTGIFACPQESARTKDSTGYKNSGWYGISPLLSSRETGKSSAEIPDPYMRHTVFLYAKITHPTNNFLRADGGSGSSWIQEFNGTVKSTETKRRELFGYNHQGKTNFLFLDMHVEALASAGITAKCRNIGF